MQTTALSDEDILLALQGNEASRNKALRHVFEKLDWKGLVIGYILQNGGFEADAQAIAVDSLAYFDRNIRNGRFKGESTLKTYFLSIAKRQWWRYLERRKTFDELNPQEHDQKVNTAEDYILKKEKVDFLKIATSVLGEKCQQLFKMKQLDYSSEEMAANLGLKNGAMAKKALYRCRQKFREYLSGNSQWKELLD